MEQELTPTEIAADQAAEAAMRAHAAFREAHWGYFTARWRIDPVTRLPAVEPRPALDRESMRLAMLAAQANRHAADVEHAACFPAP